LKISSSAEIPLASGKLALHFEVLSFTWVNQLLISDDWVNWQKSKIRRYLQGILETKSLETSLAKAIICNRLFYSAGSRSTFSLSL